MTTKNWLLAWLIGGFFAGFLIVGMALMAWESDKWYREVTSHPHYRAMLVDYTAEGDTVTIFDFHGDEVRIIKEP